MKKFFNNILINIFLIVGWIIFSVKMFFDSTFNPWLSNSKSGYVVKNTLVFSIVLSILTWITTFIIPNFWDPMTFFGMITGYFICSIVLTEIDWKIPDRLKGAKWF
jgi:hypothetical protein